jgi:hypothetical protein
MSQLTKVSIGIKESYFGYRVSFNTDGSIAIIGAPGENHFTGAVYIYSNVNGVWTQIARLASGEPNSYFGVSASLSADGTVALIGAYNENSGTGAAYIYQLISGTWTQIARLADGGVGSYFGYSSSLSSDGKIVAIGAYGENHAKGAVHIYQNIEDTWTKTEHLVNKVTLTQFGFSVSLSADGKTLIVGAYRENNFTGAAYIYQNSAGTWTQTARLAGEIDDASFGYRVSLSADGSIAVIGVPAEIKNTGAVYVYQNIAGVWTQTAKLTNDVAGSYFGSSVALSLDSKTIAIGASAKDAYTGAAYIYRYTDNTWKQTYEKASDKTDGMLGFDVALNKDGTVTAIGATREDDCEGAVYILS